MTYAAASWSVVTWRAQRAFAVWFICALGACSLDDRQEHCSSASDCASSEMCYRGFCVQRDDDDRDASTQSGEGTSTPRIDGGTATGSKTNANTGSGSGGSGGSASGGSGGTSGTSSAGRGGAGGRPVAAGSGGANATCEAEAEQCNSRDDDCDGLIDEQADRDCFPETGEGCSLVDGGWSCEGTCAVGKRKCSAGQLGTCEEAKVAAAAESCTPSGQLASDENCNGMVDETCACTAGETRSCYNGRAGTMNVGKCVPGTQACVNGMLGACTNAVTPGNETCGNPNADDNCDGITDNIPNLDAACVSSKSGICRAGTLKCQNGASELTCVTPAPKSETCNGQDDNCDGVVDDTFDFQTDEMNCGACGVACARNESCCGGTCAKVQTDANNCGACGMQCAAGGRCTGGRCMQPGGMSGAGASGAGTSGAGTGGMSGGTGGTGTAGAPNPGGCEPACSDGKTCCGGTCVDTQSDLNNCGACGTACSTGVQPACCKGMCADLMSNANCGMCGTDCSLLLEGGLTCTCTKMGNGTIGCTGPLLNLCL